MQEFEVERGLKMEIRLFNQDDAIETAQMIAETLRIRL